MPKLATPLFCALLAALALAASAGTATASPLKLDRSFGKAGLVQPDFGPAYLPISYDAVQAEPSGAVVVARALGGSGPVWRRYDATGVLDPSFDPNSGAYPPIEAVTAEGKTLRPDGGLILRYNADGTWDKTFGVDPEPGHRPFSEAVPFLIRALVSLPSGKIAAAGWDIKHDRRRREIRQILVARFDSQGHLDPGFGGDGVVNLASDAGFAVKRLAGLAAHGDEGVVVAADERLRRSYGITNPFHGNSLVLALGADGRPDPAFGKEGAVRSRSSIEEFQVLPGGNLLVAGDRWGAELHVNSARLSDLYAMRLTPAGQPDPGFDGDGLAVADFGGVDRFGSLQVEADGGLLLGGSSTGIGDRICVRFPGYCTETPVLARLLADGTPDPGFGDGGRVRLKALSEPFASLGAGGGVEALAPLPGGEVAAGGSSGAVAFLAKIDRAGALVGGFGSGGVVTERDPHHNETTAHAVAVDARGRILVAGSTSAGTFYASPENGVVIRFLPDGRLDRAFGEGGLARIPGGARAIATGPRGDTFVLSGENGFVVHLTPRGRIDRRFGDGGAADLPQPPRFVHEGRREWMSFDPRSIVATADGGVVVGGEGGSSSKTRMVIARLDRRGQPDPRFAGNGLAILALGPIGECNLTQIALRRDGRILLAGRTRERDRDRSRRPVLVQLRPDGSLDRSFGRSGVVTVLQTQRESVATSLGLRPDGGILLAGQRGSHNKATPFVLAFDRDGRPDRDFNRRSTATPRRFLTVGENVGFRQILITPRRILAVGASSQPSLVFSPRGAFAGTVMPKSSGKPRPALSTAALQGTKTVLATQLGTGGGFQLRRYR